MKRVCKENGLRLLFMLLLSLLFVLWGRIVVHELRVNRYHCNLTSTEARIACLESYGWRVNPTSETRRQSTVPDPLDAVWQQYNRLQTPGGFNLERYRGKTLTCYTYLAENFPYESPEPVYVNLLIYEGTLVGGDCMSTALDGFMLPLDRRYFP